ncbi:MAG: acetyl-CoA C-acetyltransferase [Gammaproteobacteria bacterium]|nr:acetyl-CoA C-acetyltransferase [Gammaproteobacteria bacterium]
MAEQAASATKKRAATKKKRSTGSTKPKMRTVYIVDGARTPQLKALDRPGPFSASDLATLAGRSLLARLPFTPQELDEVILGCVMPGPDEVNIARIVALRLGCGDKVPAFTVQRNCASGMQAVDTAARNIAMGRSELVLAGGTEAMSHGPILLDQAMVIWLGQWAKAKTLGARLKALSQLRPKHFRIIIGLLRGLSDPIVGLSMGQTTENLAYRFGISREEMDAYALMSHQRLAAAQDAGHIPELEAIYDHGGRFYDFDTGLRRDGDMAKLGKLKPVFDRPYGLVTAGNSAQITDGAAWLVLASEEAVKKYDLPVLGRLVDSEWAGLDPAQMGLGPVHAMTPLMQRNKLALDDVDYFEINEAFAGQVLANQRAWNEADYCKQQLGLSKVMGQVDSERLNIDGGGVSLGHPVGASGARIILHLLHILQRKDAKRGIASLCIGGGQGGAVLVERGAE